MIRLCLVVWVAGGEIGKARMGWVGGPSVIQKSD